MLSREHIPHYFRILLQKGREFLSRKMVIIKSHWWGVNIGTGLTACGVMKLRKAPGSKMVIGKRCRILSKFDSNLHGLNRKSMFSTLCNSAQLVIGDDCGFSGLIIACADSITIGNRVMIGANCTITDTNSHSLDFKERFPDYYNLNRNGWKEHVITAPVIIEDDVFIGMNTIILKGVTIRKGAIIGAGSVITRSIPSYVIAAGNPAVPLKNIIVEE